MRTTAVWTTLIFILAPIYRAEAQKPVTDFGLSPHLLITMPFDEIGLAETLSIEDLTDKDRKAALTRIKELPKLTTLKFYSCDLSHVDEKDPIPANVKGVLISGGKFSQGTIRWLAKFPSGIEIAINCDVRKLDLDLGKFKWVMFDNCQMSRSAITKLVEKSTQVTFKEIRIEDDK